MRNNNFYFYVYLLFLTLRGETEVLVLLAPSVNKRNVFFYEKKFLKSFFKISLLSKITLTFINAITKQILLI